MKKTNLDLKNVLRNNGPIAWEKIFEIWRETEADQEKWVNYYQGKGFSSWKDWRQSYVERFGYNKKSWDIYSIIRPLEVVPHFHGGPFRTWINKYYHGEELPTFQRLVEMGDVKANSAVVEISKNFPLKTFLIGLLIDGEVVIIEGMHRCCAMTLMKEQKEELKSIVEIALAEYSKEEISKFLEKEMARHE